MASTTPTDSAPYLHANRCSRFVHHWLSPLLKKSRQQGTLYLADLYDVPDDCKSLTLTDKLEANWLAEVNRNPHNPSLLRATLRTFGWKPFLYGFLEVVNTCIRIAQPLLLTFLMAFFEPCSTTSKWQAWLLATTLVVTTFINSSILHAYFYQCALIAMRMRIAYMGLIFRKVLCLSTRSMNSLGSGGIANLMSNDAKRIEICMFIFNHIWTVPIGTILVCYLFWSFVKYIAFIAIGYTLILLSLQIVYGKLVVFLHTRIVEATDKRIKIMSEIIKSMRIVKMYCWETAFMKNVDLVRKHEIVQYTKMAVFDCFQLVIIATYTNMTFLIMYGTMWLLDLRIDIRFFAVASCILIYIKWSVVELFSLAIRELAHYLPALKRIEAFLLLDESERDYRLLSLPNINLISKDEIKVFKQPKKEIKYSCQVICNLRHAQWRHEDAFSLKHIVFDAHPGDLICIVGPVGSGKSSLLQTLTGEISYFDGKIRLNGSFFYVPQEAWIFSSTIRNNILFGKEYDAKLFHEVITATALETDFNQLPNGADTLVGDQGITLSGGQKARVSMARALYRNADIYLLDDPLSAVDVRVSKHLFEKSIKGYLKDKICILATHQVQFLQDATKIITLDDGRMTHMGTYAELLETSTTFARLLEDINEYEKEIRMQTQKQLSVASSIVSEEDKNEIESDSFALVDKKQNGAVSMNVYLSYFRAGLGSMFGFIILMLVFTAQQSTLIYSGWWLATWSNTETNRHLPLNNCMSTDDDKTKNIHSMNITDWQIYRRSKLQVYCALIGILFFLSFLQTIATKVMCLNSGRILHNSMFKRIIRSPISFFDTNPIGRILNRFTNDINVMDERLVEYLVDLFDSAFGVLGTVALVCILNPWSLIPTAVGVVFLLVTRHRFARCSRDLKRLDGATKTPIFSYLTSTIHGLKVIRSCHVEKMCCDEFFHHMDNNTRVNFLNFTLERWAGIRFGWISCLFLVAVTFLALIIRIYSQEFSASDIALTLSFSLNLIGLCQWTIRVTVNVETFMTAVERVIEYCNLDQEPPTQVPVQYRAPADWPSYGCIVFEDVAMSYSKDEHAPLVLKNLSFTIRQGEKVGIVGRTGAGKSSLIQTLFRMGYIVNGQVRIDNINIEDVGLDDARSRIAIIPQDPILFSGTIRSNLDPFNNYSDDNLWDALEQVQLKEFVKDKMLDGLDSTVAEGGSNLSVGQKQLICLARAILKKTKILIVDEATANVDNATDELIQKSIRSQFRQCTVLTVAHRIRTIIDSDRIMVLSNGEMIEFDTPKALLSNPQSYFSLLIQQAGAAEVQYLQTFVGLDPHINTEYQKSHMNNDANSSSSSSSSDPNENDPLLS